MATQPQPRVTLEDYLLLEEQTGKRYDFHDGEVFEMEAATPNHAQLCAQVGAELLRAFPNCRVFDGSLVIYVQSGKRLFHPDAAVICEPAETVTATGQPLAVRNPYLIVEVLSPNTQDFDRGEKANLYRTLPSLQHLVFVSQHRVFVEHYERLGDDRWSLTNYREETFPLFSLSAVYRDVPLLGTVE